MRRYVKPWHGALLLALLAVNGRETAMAEDLGAARTWCIGRHLVEVPAVFEPVEHYGIIEGMRIDALGPGSPADLSGLAKTRVAELKAGRGTDQGVALVYKDDRREGDIWVVAHRIDTSALGTTFEDWTEEAYLSSGGEMYRITAAIAAADAARAQGGLLTLARALSPRAEGEVPPGTGACLPGAFAEVGPVSEAHGMTFSHESGEKPLGLRVEVVLRRPDDVPLEVEADLPGGLRARAVEIAGLPGRAVSNTTGAVGFGAVAGQPQTDGTAGVKITVEYFDERPEFGAAPVTRDQAAALWPVLLNSIREKR